MRDLALKIIALLAIRNEAPYLERCLRHLAEQGVAVWLIDNDSDDGSREIAESFMGRGVIGIERLPFTGFYDWRGILLRKAALARELDADWFLIHDADEIRQSPLPGQTLAQAIGQVDAKGYNAVEFLEFVFLPTDPEEDVVGRDFVAALPYAYYFQPYPEHRVNAWKNQGQAVELVSSGGHRAEFDGRRTSPRPLILRHYPFLSWRHLVAKYRLQRRYSDYEVRVLNWHGKRATFDESEVRLPRPEELIHPDRDGWDTRRPWNHHPFLGEMPK